MNTRVLRRSAVRGAVRFVAFALGLFLGIVLAAALRGSAVDMPDGTALQLLEREKELTESKDELLLQLNAVNARLNGMEEEAARASEENTLMRIALERTRILSGQTDMMGPGVRVVLEDAPRESIAPGDDIMWYIVHDVDVLRVVNQLRAAGAECVSINGERIVSNSRIRCGGPAIHVKERVLAPPFEILAIGDPDSLYNCLAAPASDGGMSEIELLGFYGVRAQVHREQMVTVPRYIGEFRFSYATAVADAYSGAFVPDGGELLMLTP